MFDLSVISLGLAAFLSGSSAVMGVDGRVHHPMIEARGKPVALIFIAHDCPICNGYAPEIGRISKLYAGRIAVDIVYSEPGLSALDAKSHAKEYALQGLPLMMDSSRRFASACGASVTPQAVLFDASGHLAYSGRIDNRYASLGVLRPTTTQRDLRSAIDAVLAHKRPSPSFSKPVGCYILKPESS